MGLPGCYPERRPHIHFEVDRSLTAAANARNRTAMSQLAFAPDAWRAAYTAPEYAGSRGNL